MQQVDLRVWVVGKLHLHFQHTDQPLPLASCVVDWLQYAGRGQRSDLTTLDAFERVQRGTMIVLQVENVPVEIDRAINVIESLLVELGDPVLITNSLRGVSRQLRLVRKNTKQLLPVLGSLI